MVQHNALISVIIPIYNAERYLERCIKSVLKQSYKNLEIILINDGSIDGSLKICEKMRDNDNRVILFSQKNAGVSAARNLGIIKSSGKFITFVDSDDWIEIDEITTLYHDMVINNVELSMCNYYWDYENGNEYYNKIESYTMDRQEFYKDVLNKNLFQGFLWNKLFCSNIIKEKTIQFDENIKICEDLKFVCEYAKYIKYASYNARPFYHYIQRNNSAFHMNTIKNYLTILIAYEKVLNIYENNCQEIAYIAKEKYIRRTFECKFRIKKTEKKYQKFIELYCKNSKTLYKEIKNYYKGKEAIDLWLLIYFPYLHELFRANWLKIKPFIKGKKH